MQHVYPGAENLFILAGQMHDRSIRLSSTLGNNRCDVDSAHNFSPRSSFASSR